MTATVDVQIAEPEWSAMEFDPEITAVEAIRAAAARTEAGDVTLLLTNDAEMCKLNRQWRAKQTPTDVLSFPAEHVFRPFLGDIAIGLEISRQDARAQNKRLDHHLSHLAVHGYLHLLGYDHESMPDAEIMENLEREILASLGISDPYFPANTDTA